MSKRHILYSIVLGGAIFGACKATKNASMPNPFPPITVQYPMNRQDASIKDDYHGTTVADPYRWLEDDNSEETKAWVKAQNDVTFGYLNQIPFRKDMEARLTKIYNYERFGAPSKEGNLYYFFRNDGLQNQAVLYSQASLDGEAKIVLDPNTLSKDGTVALGNTSYNKEGSLLGYTVSEAGSDWNTARVRDLKTGKDLSDEVRWIKFSGLSWYKNGFFYSRYPEPKAGDALKGKSLNHRFYYHAIGTPQSQDELIYSDDKNPNYNMYGGVTEDEAILVLSISESTSGNKLYARDQRTGKKEFTKLVDHFDNDWDVVDHDKDWLLVLTTKDAPNKKLIAIPTKPAINPNPSSWITLVPETKDVLQSAQVIGGKLILQYLHNAYSQVKIYSLDGKLERELELPTIGTVSGISGKKDARQAFYSFTSFTYPATVFELDVQTGSSKIFKAPKVDFDPSAYETKQIWYTSKDGVKVPMFVTHKKGLKLNGKNPTLLYGYGGFNISLTPSFSVARLMVLENNGVYAVPNLRGGGEFGEEWHKAGTKERKQNVFNDFIAAAETLIQQGYTSKEYLAIHGGSNGGLLVGACMTQRPDLFRVAFPAVGVLDMLRYHQFTIGRAWAIDYGLSEDPEGFKYLYKYSPLHNVRKTVYPYTMVMTADHDDRVVPAHSFKFAATLQEHHQGKNPVIIRVETSAGHGAGKPTKKLIAEAADMYSFMFHSMGIKPAALNTQP